MFNAHKMSLAVKVGLGLALAVPTVNAQTDDHGLVEEVMVTGSRIARDPLSTTGPITVVDAEAIGQSGVSSVDDLLVKMPAVGTNGLGKNDNNGGGGLAWVDLRNLGSSRTLVLVNGRRFVASSSGVASAVDLGNIPVAMIDRIEVLTDGASAVYGADAVAVSVAWLGYRRHCRWMVARTMGDALRFGLSVFAAHHSTIDRVGGHRPVWALLASFATVMVGRHVLCRHRRIDVVSERFAGFPVSLWGDRSLVGDRCGFGNATGTRGRGDCRSDVCRCWTRNQCGDSFVTG